MYTCLYVNKCSKATDVSWQSVVNDDCRSDLHWTPCSLWEEEEICHPAASWGRSITLDRPLFFSVLKSVKWGRCSRQLVWLDAAVPGCFTRQGKADLKEHGRIIWINLNKTSLYEINIENVERKVAMSNCSLLWHFFLTWNIILVKNNCRFIQVKTPDKVYGFNQVQNHICSLFDPSCCSALSEVKDTTDPRVWKTTVISLGLTEKLHVGGGGSKVSFELYWGDYGSMTRWKKCEDF